MASLILTAPQNLVKAARNIDLRKMHCDMGDGRGVLTGVVAILEAVCNGTDDEQVQRSLFAVSELLKKVDGDFEDVEGYLLRAVVEADEQEGASDATHH